MADFKEEEDTTPLIKGFHEITKAFANAMNVSDCQIMGLCLDVILTIHMHTSSPEYTDEHLVNYVRAVTAKYREAYRKGAN